jgi:hypothetical protein
MYLNKLINHYVYNIKNLKKILQESKNSKDQVDFINRMYDINPNYSNFIHPKYLKNKASILTIFKRDKSKLSIFEIIPKNLRYDKDFIKELLSNINECSYPLDKLWDFRYLFTRKNSPLCTDEYIKELIEIPVDNLFMMFFSTPVMKNKKIIKHIIDLEDRGIIKKRNVEVYMDKSLFNDKDFMLECLREYKGFLPKLEGSEKNFFKDKDIRKEYIVKNPATISWFIDDEIYPDIIDVIKNIPSYLYMLNQKYIDKIEEDSSLCKDLVKKDARVLQYFNNKIRNNRDIFKYAFHNCYYSLDLLGDELKNDKEVIDLSIEKNGGNIKYIPENLQDDNLCKLAIETNGLSVKYFKDEYKNKYIEKAMKNNWESIIYVSDNQIKDTQWLVRQLEVSPYNIFTEEWDLKMLNLNGVVKIEDDLFSNKNLIEKIFNKLMINEDVKEILEKNYFNTQQSVEGVVLKNPQILCELLKYLEENQMKNMMKAKHINSQKTVKKSIKF